MFKRILVANRGEIAARIIRTCRLLGIETIAVYSEPDNGSLHVRMADKAARLNTAGKGDGYLDIDQLVGVASKLGADAVHPGYGFLSEDWKFASACERAGIRFIGPPPRTLASVSNKVSCKGIAQSRGIPTVEGSGPITGLRQALRIAHELGYPILLKPVRGGGGRGIRTINDDGEMSEVFKALPRVGIGPSGFFLERYISPVRHLEVQTASDGHGKVIHLGERECTIQRRYQKLIEMTPAPLLREASRERLLDYAIRLMKGLSYENIGTVEFVMDTDENFYFTEVNPRLQVEHPITEAISGVDLVELQLRIASGEGIVLDQEEVHFKGAAIECRINAEDPVDLLPSIGRITEWHIPTGMGIRVETAVSRGSSITSHYDPLLAKLVAWGENLKGARTRMLQALDEFYVRGIKTTIPLHKIILNDRRLLRGGLNTMSVENGDIRQKLIDTVFRERALSVQVGAAIAATMMEMDLRAKPNYTGNEHNGRAEPAHSMSGRFYEAI